MGALLLFLRSPRYKQNFVLHPADVLVAVDEGGRSGLCRGLLGLCPGQGHAPVPTQVITTSPHPSPPLVTNRFGFRYRSAPILTIVDRFSKAVHFIPLTKLPSASDTAQLLVTHVVRLHGIPTDIVSDRGPQFTARFWRAFCTLLGTQVSLSLGFHPQSNGQTERANQSLETSVPGTPRPGAPNCRGRNTPSTPRSQLLLISPLSNVASGTSPHCFPAMNCR